MRAEFRQLNQRQEYIDACPLVQAQNPDLNESEYWRLLAEMLYAGHLIVGLYSQERLIGIVGICKGANWTYGEHLWLHLMTLAKDHRGQGYEIMMLEFVIEWAQAQSCRYIYTTLDINILLQESGCKLQTSGVEFIATQRLWRMDLNATAQTSLRNDCIE